MITLPRLRNNSEEVIARLAIRGLDASSMVNEVLTLDEKVRTLKTELEALKAESNANAASIGRLMKEGNVEEANKAKEASAQSN